MYVQRPVREFKTFRCLKTKFKSNTTIQENARLVDLFKILLGLKIRKGGYKLPKHPNLVCRK